MFEKSFVWTSNGGCILYHYDLFNYEIYLLFFIALFQFVQAFLHDKISKFIANKHVNYGKDLLNELLSLLTVRQKNALLYNIARKFVR